LNDVLNERLSNLKEVELEAKKIINLSSDAGLAGGFVQKGKQANINKIISLCVFVLALILLACFNFSTINFEELDKITLTSITIRLIINIPLLWIATVANINLNKYSKLEQEYAHKESLAKSYERYKDEISKLSTLDVDANIETQKTLHSQLISLNLEAFKKNPAEGMDHAKSNLLFDRLIPDSTSNSKT
jgi:hypothetical protein